jgi:hypothetical protein
MENAFCVGTKLWRCRHQQRLSAGRLDWSHFCHPSITITSSFNGTNHLVLIRRSQEEQQILILFFFSSALSLLLDTIPTMQAMNKMNALLLALLSVDSHAFTVGRPQTATRPATARSAVSDCFAANEFSRLMDPERFLKVYSGSPNSRNRREHHMQLEATDEECEALAQRFDLPALGPLKADMTLRPASSSSGVEVEGALKATLTQRCVRTNEDFSVAVEFPLYAIVRPVVPLQMTGVVAADDEEEADQEDDEALYASLDDDKVLRRQKRTPNLQTLDVFQLQQILQDDDGENEDLADVLMEDQAIYPAGGPLDVGELAAQLFWLQLDPYPKKPGSEAVRITISG